MKNLMITLRSFGSNLALITALILNLTLPSTALADKETININEASAEVIAETLNGIGLKKAQAIVAWRENNGAFTHKEQLTAIKGIGNSTLAKNNELIRLE